ncbi:MAG: hypothetical protein AAGB46_09480 [Verrucomicrobiota bacterium]
MSSIGYQYRKSPYGELISSSKGELLGYAGRLKAKRKLRDLEGYYRNQPELPLNLSGSQ